MALSPQSTKGCLRYNGVQTKDLHMLLKRQRQILGLLDALGGRAGNVDFQKLLFLYCMESEKVPSYDFVPYRYGCFSFTSYADRRKLAASGFLEEDDSVWQLTAAGKAAARHNAVPRKVMGVFCRKRTLRGDALISQVYQRYPYYATRSEILDRLDLPPENVHRIRAARPAVRKPGLLTIGYEGRSLEDYLNTLLRAGVTVLCDVRKNPLSRKYGFSKRALSTACEGIDVRYTHLPALGIPSERRKNLRTPSDYAALFAAYEEDTLPNCAEQLEQIGHWIRDGARVALTCYEREPEFCHRRCVAAEVGRYVGLSSCVEDL